VGIIALALVLGLALARADWLWTRPDPGERLARQSPLRARSTVDRYFRTLTAWEPWMGLALVGPFVVLALVTGAWLTAALSAGASAMFVVSAILRPRATAAVRKAAAEQGVEPLRERRASPTRERRARPWAAAVLAGVATAQLGFGLDRALFDDPGSLGVIVGTAGLCVLVIAFATLAAVSFRRYDDERAA